MENSHNYVQILIDTLQKQVDILKDVLEVTKEQSVIAGKEDFDETLLEESLNKKEVLIAKLNSLDDGFTAVYGRVRSEVSAQQDLYQEELQKMQSLIKECTDLGVEIKVLEERNRERLMRCFSQKQKQYNSLKAAASVASHYHQTMNNTKIQDSYFLDQKN